jgi:inosine/xanthosine triphosphatase
MKSIRLVVASKNPVKIKCSTDGFQKVFPNHQLITESIAVASEVADQPMTDEETLQGAINRAKNAKLILPDADYWIGLEGGIADDGQHMEAFAWIYILSKDTAGKARTASFELPPEIRKLVLSGIELGHADDQVFKRHNSKHGNGAVGILTHELIDRAAYYEPAVILALIPHVNRDLYA